MRISEKEQELLKFIQQQKPGTVNIKVYRHQPISFERDSHTDSLARARIFDKGLDKFRYKLYWEFYKNKTNFLRLCEYRYNLHTRSFRQMTIRYKLNCPYYLYCLIAAEESELSYPIISEFEEKITKKWRRYYQSSFTLRPGFVNLPKLTDVFGVDACAHCHLVCGICSKELLIRKVRAHHLAYIVEAVPTEDNLSWLKYYQLLCYKCHEKERGKVNGQKDWAGIVSRELARRRIQKQEEMFARLLNTT